MIDSYVPLLVLIIMSAGFIIILLALSIFLGPKKYTEVKDDPFECGTIGSGTLGGRHSVRFYLVAVTFIVFDLEIVFLYPWAVSVKELGWYAFWAVLPFLAILTVGLIYEWKKGVLDLY